MKRAHPMPILCRQWLLPTDMCEKETVINTLLGRRPSLPTATRGKQQQPRRRDKRKHVLQFRSTLLAHLSPWSISTIVNVALQKLEGLLYGTSCCAGPPRPTKPTMMTFPLGTRKSSQCGTLRGHDADDVALEKLVGLFLVGTFQNRSSQVFSSSGLSTALEKTREEQVHEVGGHNLFVSAAKMPLIGVTATALIAAMVSLGSAAFSTRQDKSNTDTPGVGNRKPCQ